jgi:hypothetical protein
MNPKNVGRRQFFKKSAMGVLGASLAGGDNSSQAAPQASPDAPLKIKEYRTLGRTGFQVSDISCGFIMDEGVIRAAYESGMNYFDTAEQYPEHHRVLAKVIKLFWTAPVNKIYAFKRGPVPTALPRVREARPASPMGKASLGAEPRPAGHESCIS